MDLVSIAVVLFTTLAAMVAGVYAYGMTHIHEIKQNWVQYRCNPMYMPLAGAVGSDIMSNFTNCVMQSVQSYAGFVMDPIFQNFKIFQEMFVGILDSIQFIRKKMAGTVDAFLNIVSSVFGKIQNTMGASLQLVGRIRTIMNRIISVFITMLHIAKTGVDSGMSIKNGPIGQTAEFLCFDPYTPVRMEHGSIPISDVSVGMKLYGDRLVTSHMIFDGTETKMVDLMGVVVSANHKIRYNRRWIRAGDHPDALPTDSVNRLICLTTSDHVIPVFDYLFKDYEETDDVAEFYQDVADYYKCSVPPLRTKYRETGFKFHDTHVRMEDGSTVALDEIHIGDYIAKGGRVLGLLVHKLNDPPILLSPGVSVSPGAVYLENNQLHTAATNGQVDDMYPLCVNLLTEHAKVVLVDIYDRDWVFLDDQEVPCGYIHDKRDKKVVAV